MTLLLASLAAPVVAPLIFLLLRARRGTVQFLDGFVAVAVPGLVFIHVVPDAAVEGEWAILGMLLLGLAIPVILEKLARAPTDRPDKLALLLGITGLGLHALLEGAAIGGLSGNEGSPLGVAIVLHRVPVGLAIWWLIQARFGLRAAVAGLAGLLLVTLGGYAGGHELDALMSGPWFHLYEALVGGTLVHVVIHGVHPHDHEHHPGAEAGPGEPDDYGHIHPEESNPFAEGLGGLTALAGMLGMVVLAPPGESLPAVELIQRFLVLAAESAPALVLAYVAAGALQAFLPDSPIRWMSSGSSLTSAARGMAVGLPFPICSCGVVPLYRALVRKGAAPSAAMAFLVATPELGLDAIFLSIPLLGGEMAIIRVVAAAVVALLVGWWVGGRIQTLMLDEVDADAATGVDADCDCCAVPAEGPAALSSSEVPEGPRRDAGDAARAFLSGLKEVLDDTAPWILLGLLIAAAATPLLESGWLGRLPPYLDVAIFALVGFPVYVCASSATPLVAALLATGLSPGAAIAFLITGPATNATTLGVLSGLHGRRAAVAFAAVMVGLSVTLGIAVNVFVGTVSSPSLESLVEEAPGLLHQVFLVLLGGLFLWSLLRRGVRKFAGEIFGGLGNGHG